MTSTRPKERNAGRIEHISIQFTTKIRREERFPPAYSKYVYALYIFSDYILMSVEICRLPPRRAYLKRDSDFQTANLTAHQYKSASA